MGINCRGFFLHQAEGQSFLADLFYFYARPNAVYRFIQNMICENKDLKNFRIEKKPSIEFKNAIIDVSEKVIHKM